MANRVASICSERAIFYTESFKQTEGLPYILRKAKAFAHTLQNMSIYIEKDSLLFGNQASVNFAAPVFPEYSIDWIIEELDGTNGATVFRFQNRRCVSMFSKSKRRSLFYCKLLAWTITHEDEVQKNLSEEIRLAAKQGVLHLGGISMSGDGHIVPNYPFLLKNGFRYIINKAKTNLKLKIFFSAN